MIDANEIKAAVALMDAKDATQWEGNGAPKLDIIQKLMGNAEVTVDDVDEALGAFKRGDAVPAAVKPAKVAKAAAPPVSTAPAVQAEPEVDISTLDRNSPEYAIAVVRVARAANAIITDAIAASEAVRDEAIKKIVGLRKQADVHIGVIERYGPKASDAESVKAIQAQTLANLKRQKEGTAIAQIALAASGGVTVFPSKLDQQLSMRKRTTEQQADYAKFVHQRAAEMRAGG